MREKRRDYIFKSYFQIKSLACELIPVGTVYRMGGLQAGSCGLNGRTFRGALLDQLARIRSWTAPRLLCRVLLVLKADDQGMLMSKWEYDLVQSRRDRTRNSAFQGIGNSEVTVGRESGV